MLENWERTAKLAMALVLVMAIIACLFNIITLYVFDKKERKINAGIEFFTYTFCFMPVGCFMWFSILGGWYFDRKYLLLSFAINSASTILGIVMIVYVKKILDYILKHNHVEENKKTKKQKSKETTL